MESTCARVYPLIKLQVVGLQLIKKRRRVQNLQAVGLQLNKEETSTAVFFWEFNEIFKSTYFAEDLQMTASATGNYILEQGWNWTEHKQTELDLSDVLISLIFHSMYFVKCKVASSDS